MTVAEAKALLGVTTHKQLGALLGVTRQAVTQWKPDIPDYRRLQVLAIIRGE